MLVAIILTVLAAGVAYWLLSGVFGLPQWVGIVAALLILVIGLTGGSAYAASPEMLAIAGAPLGKKLLPNRIAVYMVAAAALIGGLAPVVADLDLNSTLGIAAGLAALVAVVNRWLIGWQQHEARQPIPPV